MILEGRVAIVTGSGRGIGRGIALKLAEKGAKVVVNGVTPEMINETVKLISDEGNEAIGVRADVTNAKEVEAMVEKTLETYSRVDILVNNAAVLRDAMFHKMTEEQWDIVIDTHLKGCFLCSRAAAPHMRKNGYGRIINISSGGGYAGNVGMINYVSAKAGTYGFTMALAKELARWVRKDGADLTCNCINPGFNKTRMIDGIPEAVVKKFIEEIPLRRVSDPREDMGNAVAFLASKDASYITGTIMSVGGGILRGLARHI
jgi:NAD(P)-dependent dehydrogenase (short-subunit alcohol dehydrogenase family)